MAAKRLDELFFRFGQVERGAIAAFEAFFTHLHLFAFKFAGDSDDSDDDVSGFGGGNGGRLGFEIDQRPDEFGGWFGVFARGKVDFELGSFAGLKMHAANLGIDAVVVPGGGYVFAVETNAEETVRNQPEVVVAGGGSGEVGLPLNGERIDARGGSGDGRETVVEDGINARGERVGALGVVNIAEIEFCEVDADSGLALEAEG